MGAVAWALRPTPRFPSPLIKPDEPISGIWLSVGLNARHTTSGRCLLVSGDDTSACDGLRQAVELSLKALNLIRRPSEAAETGKVIDGFIKAYQVAEVDDRVARVEQLSDAEMLRIAAGCVYRKPDPSR
jgi:HEPN domain-containing protein